MAPWSSTAVPVLLTLALLSACSTAGTAVAQEPDDPFLPEQRIFSRNPRLAAWISTSQALRLKVRLEDLESGEEVEIRPPSPRIYLPRDADYLYVLVADAEGGFLLFDRPRFHGVAIYDRRGEKVSEVLREEEILFSQLPDGRFVLADAQGLAGYTARGEEVWRRPLPQVDRLEPLPPAAFGAGRYLAAEDQRTSAAVDAATGEVIVELRGPTARPPSILLYEPESRRRVSSQRQAAGRWELRLDTGQAAGWTVELPCNPVAAARRDQLLAVLLTCLDPADDSRYPQSLLVVALEDGSELLRRELGVIESPTGRYALDWSRPDEIDILLGSRVESVEIELGPAP